MSESIVHYRLCNGDKKVTICIPYSEVSSKMTEECVSLVFKEDGVELYQGKQSISNENLGIYDEQDSLNITDLQWFKNGTELVMLRQDTVYVFAMKAGNCILIDTIGLKEEPVAMVSSMKGVYLIYRGGRLSLLNLENFSDKFKFEEIELNMNIKHQITGLQETTEGLWIACDSGEMIYVLHGIHQTREIVQDFKFFVEYESNIYAVCEHTIYKVSGQTLQEYYTSDESIIGFDGDATVFVISDDEEVVAVEISSESQSLEERERRVSDWEKRLNDRETRIKERMKALKNEQVISTNVYEERELGELRENIIKLMVKIDAVKEKRAAVIRDQLRNGEWEERIQKAAFRLQAALPRNL